jgi:hypothetical protein
VTCDHNFAPFPGSARRLYCSRCGTGMDAFATTAKPSEPRSRRSGRVSSLAAQPRLPLDDPAPSDPDAGRAREILNERGQADFEQRIEDVLNEAGVSHPARRAYWAHQAKMVGPDVLDWDAFSALMQVEGAPEEPPQRPGEEGERVDPTDL